MSAGWGGARSGAGRRSVTLLELVQNRRFRARNGRHRRKLVEDDSLLEFMRENEGAPPALRELAALQERYRHDHRLLDRSWSTWAARQFELGVRELDEAAV